MKMCHAMTYLKNAQKATNLLNSKKILTTLCTWTTSSCLQKTKKRCVKPNTNNTDIKSGHRDGIWHIKICPANNQKRKKANNGSNRIAKSKKNQKIQRKGNLQVLGNIRSRHNQTSGNEIKIRMNI